MHQSPDISELCLDDQFMILLHKKIMNKTGSAKRPAKRRAKKYYMDQYKKTGIIPKPLWLAAEGIMEGRKCSGRSRALSPDIKNRFIQMVKASCDADDPRFIYSLQVGDFDPATGGGFSSGHRGFWQGQR